jgi:hypothetical protein
MVSPSRSHEWVVPVREEPSYRDERNNHCGRGEPYRRVLNIGSWLRCPLIETDDEPEDEEKRRKEEYAEKVDIR